MNTASSKPWLKLCLLVVLLLVTAALLQPVRTVRATCYQTQWTYYFDPGHTQYAGHCEEDCQCHFFCTGVKTQYFIASGGGCL